MFAVRLLRAIALVVFAAVLVGGSPISTAFAADDPAALEKRAGELYEAEKYAEALAVAQEAVAAAEAKFGADDPRVGEPLNLFGLVQMNLGNHAAAETSYRRAIALSEASPERDTWTTGARLNNLAILLNRLNRDDEAIEAYKRAAVIAEKVFGPFDAMVGKVLTNSSLIYWKQGRFSEATALCERGLAIREKAPGPKHTDLSHSLHFLALIRNSQGRYSEAERLEKRAFAIDEAAFGPEHPIMGTRLSTIADAYRLAGRYEDAEPLYKRGLDIAEKNQSEQLSRGLLNNLAWIYRQQGRLDEAEPMYRRAIEIAERTAGPNDYGLISQLHNLATLLRERGQYSEAEALLQRALAIAQGLKWTHPHLPKVLDNLGKVYQRQGRLQEAESQFTQARNLAEKALGPDHPEVADYLSDLGELRAANGNFSDAASLLQRGADLALASSKRIGDVLGQVQTGIDAGDAARSSQRLALLTKVLGQLAQQAPERRAELTAVMFEAAQRAQGSEAAVSLSKMAARGAKGDAELAALARERQDLASEWKERDKAIVAALARSPEQRNAAAEQLQRDRMLAIDTRITDIDATLMQKFPEYSALTSPAPMSIQDVQASLEPEEAAVLFFDTPALNAAGEETFVWAVTKTGMRWARSDLGRTALQTDVQALRCGLDEEQWATPTSARRCFDLLGLTAELDASKPLPFDLGRAYGLYRGLFGQVEDLIEGKRLLIVPSGPLTSLPFLALVARQPAVALPDRFEGYRGVEWLGKRNAIAILPAVASLKALRQNIAGRQRATEDYAGFGNPVLKGDGASCRASSAPGQCPASQVASQGKPQAPQQVAEAAEPQRALIRGRGGRRSANATADKVFAKGAAAETVLQQVRALCPLPDTRYEISCIASRFKQSVSLIRLEGEATEADIKSLSESGKLARYRILHFATHGLLSGDVESMAKRQGEPALVLTPPDKPANADDDGLLTASEVSALKLNADWVVLSACNTAAADKAGAEALSGLARAFFYAGARALLVSHWPVYSDAAVRLTTQAFAELDSDPKAGRAEAMQRAMIALLADRSQIDNAHPSVWAPFVVVGEGGR